ncbi:MAG: hypothetical protein VX768_03935 [Planctomycetota bacterium]|nr:hypothetical protein [Planctomycetota bacterium]
MKPNFGTVLGADKNDTGSPVEAGAIADATETGLHVEAFPRWHFRGGSSGVDLPVHSPPEIESPGQVKGFPARGICSPQISLTR